MILATATGGGNFSMIIILVVMIALMYFMMIRPQSKEKKRMNEMLNSMAIGDAVLTSSGFYGVVIEITDNDVIVEFGNNKNCRIPMRKSAIIQVEKPGMYSASSQASQTVEKDTKAKDKIEEKAAEAAETVEDAAAGAAEAVEETADAAADAVKEAKE